MDLYKCEYENCSAKYSKLNSLRQHAKRSHSVKISVLKRKCVSLEQKRLKQREYTSRHREKKRMEKRSRRLRRKTLYSRFGTEEANRYGVFGCRTPLLEYKLSKIEGAGNGVFALYNFQAGDIVSWFSGSAEATKIDDGSYSIAMSNGLVMNCIQTPIKGQGMGSFINREDRSLSKSRKNCAIIECLNEKHRLYLEIINPVKQGDELYTTYSRGYRICK